MAKDTKKRTAKSKPAPQTQIQDKIVLAALKLAETRDWKELTLEEIARSAKVPFIEMIDILPSKTDILAAYIKIIDKRVLAMHDGDALDEPVRERLLDVWISRVEQMAPEKAALKRIHGVIRRDAGVMARLNQTALRSQMKMLAAAGGSVEGMPGMIRAQGLVYHFARAIEVWLEDDDAGMARTMAELDRRLRAGEDAMGRIKGGAQMVRMAGSFARSFCRELRNRRDTDKPSPEAS